MAERPIVGLGECSLDRVCVVASLPRDEGKIDVEAIHERPGGQIATAILGVRRLGHGAVFLGCVGDDPIAEPSLAPLAEAGVDVSQVQTVAGVASRTAIVLVEAGSGRRCVLGHRDPQLRFTPLQTAAQTIDGAALLLVDATDPEAALWAATRARGQGVPVVLDADAPWPGMERLLAQVDFPVVAAEFAEECGSGDVRAGLEAIQSHGARLAVATLGAAGAVALGPKGFLESPAWPVDVLDTTGAGDAFRAGFACAVLDGLDAEGCLARANLVAALSCRGLGAQGALPDPAAVEQRLAAGPSPLVAASGAAGRTPR